MTLEELNNESVSRKYDYLIVGAGLYGATFARLMTDAGRRCLVVDRRNHVGGNVYCENLNGICIHRYGPHIFHTKIQEVWEFVNRFVSFNDFQLNTIANYKGEHYNLPFNMNTFQQLWGVKTADEAREKIKSQCYTGIVHNLEEQALSLVGRDVYEKLIKGYTEKQWGRPCSELPAFIIRRLPVRFTFDNNYFNDPYQGIPIEGYNHLIDRLLEGSDVITECDFFDGLNRTWRSKAQSLVFTGQIDAFFSHCYGALRYRSLRFETEVIECPDYQGVALMNYTDKETPYTRIIEHKHFLAKGKAVYDNPRTVITREFPADYEQGMEAFYPVNDDENVNLYNRYRALAEAETGVIFGGRLAEYRYYDMDQTIFSAMQKAHEELKKKS